MVIKKSSVENRQSSSGVPSGQFRRDLQERLRRGGAIAELTEGRSAVAGYSPDNNNVSVRSLRISIVRSHNQETAGEDTAG
jgi:hypothetical protein